MELLRFGIVCVSICLCMFVRPSAGNAWLMDPPSRSAAWNYGIKAPINYDFRTLNCGDQKVILLLITNRTMTKAYIRTFMNIFSLLFIPTFLILVLCVFDAAHI